MARGFVNLPAYRTPGPLDFSGLNEGIDALGQRVEKNRLLDQSKQIGTAIQSGDYKGGASKAFEFGDLNTGMNLANTQRQIEQDQFNRSRMTQQDARAAAAEGRSSQLHGLTMEKTQDDMRSNLISRTAGIAQRIRNETDPQRKALLVQTFASAHPRLKGQLDAYNFDPANPDPVLDMIIAEAQGLTTPAKDEFQFTKYGVGNKRTGELQPYPEGVGGADAEYGTSIHYYEDAQGNTQAVQVSKAGGRRDVDLPEGARWLPGVQFQDTGTGIVPLDRRTGQPAAPTIQKDIAGEAAAREVGKAQGEAQVRLPQLESQADDMLNTIQSVLDDPYLPSMTGMVAGRMRNITGDAARVQSKLDQLQGQVFLQGYERLKGGGVITDFEGRKGEQAIARIQDPSMSYKDYVEAVHELRDIVKAASQRARGAAGGGTQAAPPAGSGSTPPTAASPFPEYPNARQAQDGNWYVEQNGQFFRIDQ